MLVFAAALLWGLSATLARFVFHRRQVPALTVVELRLMIAVAFLGPWLALRRPARLVIRRSDLGSIVILGLFGVAAVQGSYYYSIAKLGVGLAILIQYLAPALILVFEFLRGSRIRPSQLLAVTAAVVGTALVVGTISASAMRISALDWCIGFGSAFAFAFYIVYSKGRLERYAPETILLYTFTIAASFWAIVTPPWKILSAGYGADLWLMFLALGLFSTLVPFTLFYAGLKHLSSSEASIVATLEPVVAVFTAAAFLGEGLRGLQWLGAALVLAGAASSSARKAKPLPAQPHVA